MNGEIRSLNSFRLKARASGYCRETGYDPEALAELRRRIERRAPQAGRLVSVLDGYVKDPRRRALIQFCLVSALELLPLERVNDDNYLPPLRVWHFGRGTIGDPEVRRLVEEGQETLRNIDAEFAERHDLDLCLQLTGDERRLVRQLFGIIARASAPNQKP